MGKPKERIVLSWSGGKDSAMALWELRRSPGYEVGALLTVLTEDDERISMHGIPRCLLEQQAEALGLPLEMVFIPRNASNAVYLERLNAVLSRLRDSGFAGVAFGDLYLDDLRDFREENTESLGLQAIFPLWHRDTKELGSAFLNAKFKAVVTCVEEGTLDSAFTGRMYDRQFLSDLPITVDPCGENGEFHTFVIDGPLFKHPLPVELGARTCVDRFHYCDLTARPLGAYRRLVKTQKSSAKSS